jgi:hypothetical protein
VPQQSCQENRGRTTVEQLESWSRNKKFNFVLAGGGTYTGDHLLRDAARCSRPLQDGRQGGGGRLPPGPDVRQRHRQPSQVWQDARAVGRHLRYSAGYQGESELLIAVYIFIWSSR